MVEKMWVRKLYADRNFMMVKEIYGLRLAICCNDGGIGRGDVAVTKKVMVQQKKMGRRENGRATIQ